MAIKKIQEVKNLGIFIDYKADATLPDFKQYNLIYGWNGSGKTTLSELFNAFPSGQSKKYPSLKYKIITSDGEYDESNGIIQNVRVFNQNFIDNNIDIDECKANPIFIIGEENKKTADLIKQDEMILKGNPENPDDIGKIKELENKKKELASSETSKGEIFTNVAKTISTTFSGVSARNYRKNDAEKDFELLTKKDLLSNGEVNALLVKLKQQ